MFGEAVKGMLTCVWCGGEWDVNNDVFGAVVKGMLECVWCGGERDVRMSLVRR